MSSVSSLLPVMSLKFLFLSWQHLDLKKIQIYYINSTNMSLHYQNPTINSFLYLLWTCSFFSLSKVFIDVCSVPISPLAAFRPAKKHKCVIYALNWYFSLLLKSDYKKYSYSNLPWVFCIFSFSNDVFRASSSFLAAVRPEKIQIYYMNSTNMSIHY